MNQSPYDYFRDRVNNQIIQRAYPYIDHIHIIDQSPGYIMAEVQGSETYLTTIQESKNTYIGECTCPYASGPYCKHILALARYIEKKLPPEKNPFAFYNTEEGGLPQNIFQTYENMLERILGKPTKQKVQPKRKQHTSPEKKSLHSLQQAFGKTIQQPTDIPTKRKTNDYMIFSFQLRATNEAPFECYLTPHKIKKTGNTQLTSYSSRIIERTLNNTPQYLSKTDIQVLQILMKEVRADDNYWRSYGHTTETSVSSYSLAKITQLLEGTDKIRTPENHVIAIPPGKATLRSQVTKTNKGLSLQPILQHPSIDTATQPVVTIFGDMPYWAVAEDQNEISLHRLTNEEPEGQISFISNPHTIASEDISSFLEVVLQQAPHLFILPDNLKPQELHDLEPTPHLYLSEQEGNLLIDLRHHYHTDAEAVSHTDTNMTFFLPPPENQTGQYRLIMRNQDKEKNHYTLLTNHMQQAKLTPSEPPQQGTALLYANDALIFVGDIIPRLGDEWQVFGQDSLKTLKYHNASISFELNSGIDWLELDGEVQFGSEVFSFPRLAKLLKKNHRFIPLKDGSTGILPAEWLEQNKELLQLAEESDGKLKVSKFHIHLLRSFLEADNSKKNKSRWEQTLNTLVSFDTIEKKKAPTHLAKKLRPYQQKGFEWINFMHTHKLGGILADDMGLGKTIQTLAFLHDLYIKQKRTQPSLLVLPTSLIFNWKEEISRHAPKLRYYDSTGNQRDLEYIHKQVTAKKPDFHLVLTTYGTALRDIEHIQKINWYYLILDESQQIKNPQSLTHKAVRTIPAEHRLALTGTPIENNLNELWAQFAVLNPGMLGGQDYFRNTFMLPIQKDSNTAQADKLKQMIYPFILRRLKRDVAHELSEKTESTLHIEMTPKQKKLYQQIKQFYRHEITSQIDKAGIEKSRFKILEGLLRLRQVCCDPRLIEETYAEKSSAKLEALMNKLEEALQDNHKVLVFSQFTNMLRLISQSLTKQGYEYSYLDGKTRKREAVVREFQQSTEKNVFLISLKAGGVGLNLTQADYVFHYDPWWNPAVENQATDRTHRIGQTKQVFSYKFIMKDSVEEKILKLQDTKKGLVDDILSVDTSLSKTLSRKDIEALFQ